MLEPEQLKPEDVLKHLNDLGFRGITSQQLDDFLHDLKKLIRYEQKRSGLCSKENRLRDNNQDTSSMCSCAGSYDTDDNAVSDPSYLTRSSLSNSTEVFENKKSAVDKPSDFGGESDTSGMEPSFIRSRNLPPSKNSSFKKRQNLDPVRLYHHYKLLWKNNKIPGQNNHSQLRWVIRNKMLG